MNNSGSGIQCKQTNNDVLPKNTVTKEATAALSFKPPLTEFYLLTTAKDDVGLQEEARLFTEQQKAAGREFRVNVWGWDTIQLHAEKDLSTRLIFFTDAGPVTTKTLEVVEQLSITVEDNQTQNLSMLQQITAQLDKLNRDVAQNTVKDVSSLDTHLDRQINDYRDLIPERPQTALELLQKLEANLEAGVTMRIKFRVKANMAACELQLEHYAEAATMFMKAYEIGPEELKADAFKVIALTLQGKPAEAVEFGIQSQRRSQNEVSLITAIIEAKKHLILEKNPFNIVPDALADNKEVLFAQINYYRSFNERKQWRDLAIKAYSFHPDDEAIRRYFYEAQLDEILEARPSEESLQPKLLSIIDNLEPIWARKKQAENKWDNAHLSLTTNLVISYRLLGKYEKANEILKEAHEAVPDDPYLNELRYVFAVDADDSKTADELFSKLPLNRNTVLGRLQILINNKKWEMVNELPSLENVPDLSQSDKAFYQTLTAVAHWHLDKIKEPKSLYAELKELYPSEPIVEIAFYNIAKNKNDKSWQKDLYELAIRDAKTCSREKRMMIAVVAEKENDFDTIITLLDGIIDKDHDSGELRQLCAAYVNTNNRVPGLQFVSTIGANLLKEPYYNRIKAYIYFNSGDLRSAEVAFRSAIKLEPTRVSSHIGLIQTLMRLDERDKVSDHLVRLDLTSLGGSPIELMGIAQMLSKFGHREKGRELGYQTAIMHQDQPRVLLLYMGLFLPSHAVEQYSSPDVVSVDNAVELQVDKQKTMRVVLEDHDDRPSLNHFSIHHEQFSALIGKAVGEEALYEPGFGTAQTWVVKSIEHKYLWFLRETMENFPSKFPGVGGFYTYHTKNDDIQPILADLKKHSESRKERFRFYERDNVPIGLMVNLFNGNIIGFHQTVLSYGMRIKTCAGTNDERAKGITTCIDNVGRDIILDSYTVWIVINLNLLPVLKVLFGNLILPQSGLDEFYKIRDELNDRFESGAYLTVRYEGEHLIGQEVTSAVLGQNIESINQLIQTIKQNFEIVPVNHATPPNQFQRQILEAAGTSFFDSCYVAQERKAMLLSDDLGYRLIAQEHFQIEGTWLQACALVAEDKKVTNFSEYAKIVSGLASFGHGFLSLNENVLFEICQTDDDNLQDLHRVASYVGDKNADYFSNMRVIIEFLLKVWRMNISELKKQKATSILLARMNELTGRHGVRDDQFKKLLSLTNLYHPELHDYILAWLEGHFIPIQ